MTRADVHRLLDQLAWRVRRLHAALGWPGMAGIVFVVLALLTLFLAILPWTNDAQALQQQSEQLRNTLSQRKAVAVKLDPRSQLDDFYGMLQTPAALADALDGIYTVARNHNINIERADYQMASAGRQLQRYEITIPVRGRYTQLKGFIGELMNTFPTMALAGLSFARSSAGESGLEAQLQLVLYLKPEAQ